MAGFLIICKFEKRLFCIFNGETKWIRWNRIRCFHADKQQQQRVETKTKKRETKKDKLFVWEYFQGQVSFP